MKLEYKPSIYVARNEGESHTDFTTRILRDPRLLPEQRLSLELDDNAAFADLVQGVWIEVAPVPKALTNRKTDT
jgi:hypothetical protein